MFRTFYLLAESKEINTKKRRKIKTFLNQFEDNYNEDIIPCDMKQLRKIRKDKKENLKNILASPNH